PVTPARRTEADQIAADERVQPVRLALQPLARIDLELHDAALPVDLAAHDVGIAPGRAAPNVLRAGRNPADLLVEHPHHGGPPRPEPLPVSGDEARRS